MESQTNQSPFHVAVRASMKEKLVLVYACAFKFVIALPIAALPFISMNPNFICNNGTNSFMCSAEVACSEPYRANFTVETSGITRSLVIEKKLYCEKSSIWENSQALNCLGILLVTAFFIFRRLFPDQKLLLILVSQCLLAISAFLSSQLSSISQIAVMLLLIYMSNQCFHIVAYPFINSHLNRELRVVSVGIYNAFYALCFAVYPILDSFVLSWRKMMIFVVVAPISITLLYFVTIFRKYIIQDAITEKKKQMQEQIDMLNQVLTQNKTDQKAIETQQTRPSALGIRRHNQQISIDIPSQNNKNTNQEGLLDNYDQIQVEQEQSSPQSNRSLSIYEIIKDQDLLKITLIFIVLIISTGCTFMGSQIYMNTLPVDSYTMSIILGIFGALASLYTVTISNKYPIFNMIQTTSMLIVIVFLPFYFYDHLSTDPSTAPYKYIFVLLYIIGKTLMFVIFNFAFIFLFQKTNTATQGTIIALSQLVQIIIFSILSHYDQFLLKMSINPILSYALLSIVVSFTINMLKSNKVAIQIDDMKRLSIYSKQSSIKSQKSSTSTPLALGSAHMLPVFQAKKKREIKDFEMTTISSMSTLDEIPYLKSPINLENIPAIPIIEEVEEKF